VVDSVEKKWVLGWGKKSLLTGKMLICGNVFGCLQKHKSILNGLKGITIMFKTRCDELAYGFHAKQLSVDAFMKKKKLNCCKCYINWQNFTCQHFATLQLINYL
jgi:ribonuclease HI